MNIQHEAEKESLKYEIANLTTERVKFHDENRQLKESLSDLSFAKQVDFETAHH